MALAILQLRGDERPSRCGTAAPTGTGASPTPSPPTKSSFFSRPKLAAAPSPSPAMSCPGGCHSGCSWNLQSVGGAGERTLACHPPARTERVRLDLPVSSGADESTLTRHSPCTHSSCRSSAVSTTTSLTAPSGTCGWQLALFLASTSPGKASRDLVRLQRRHVSHLLLNNCL